MVSRQVTRIASCGVSQLPDGHCYLCHGRYLSTPSAGPRARLEERGGGGGGALNGRRPRCTGQWPPPDLTSPPVISSSPHGTAGPSTPVQLLKQQLPLLLPSLPKSTGPRPDPPACLLRGATACHIICTFGNTHESCTHNLIIVSPGSLLNSRRDSHETSSYEIKHSKTIPYTSNETVRNHLLCKVERNFLIRLKITLLNFEAKGVRFTVP